MWWLLGGVAIVTFVVALIFFFITDFVCGCGDEPYY